MATATCTKQLQSPLTCVMQIREGANVDELEGLLKKTKPVVDAALNKIGTVHFARFVLLQNRTQLAIITEFDREFDDYIKAFAKDLNDVFNHLFEYIADPPRVPVKDHRDELIEWVRAHDVASIAFYSAYPDKGVIDII
jgi:hypothetical protein